jgi:hypothetical protein
MNVALLDLLIAVVRFIAAPAGLFCQLFGQAERLAINSGLVLHPVSPMNAIVRHARQGRFRLAE